MAAQFGHKALAETHDFGVGFAVGVKVAATLAAAHRQAGQAVLEDLFKTKELDDREVDALMEAQTALVGADGGVELHTVAAVDLHLAGVVNPGHPEHHDALRLNDAFDQTVLFDFGAGRHDGFERFKNFLNRLQKLLLLGIALGKTGIHAGQISILDGHNNNSFIKSLSPVFIVPRLARFDKVFLRGCLFWLSNCMLMENKIGRKWWPARANIWKKFTKTLFKTAGLGV